MQEKLTLLEQQHRVDWRDKTFEDLFDISGTKSLDAGKLKFVDKGINFVGRISENNGIQGRITKQLFEPNKPFTITATVIGNYKYVKYQKEPYYVSQNINKLTPKFEINDSLAQFFIAYIQKFVSLWDGQQGGYKLSDIKAHSIKIPYKNGTIAFDYINDFVATLEAERLATLEAYLNVTGLNNVAMSAAERASLASLDKVPLDLRLQPLSESGQRSEAEIGEAAMLDWRPVKFDKLFNHIQQGARLTKADQKAGSIPFVMSGVTDTGVVGYISNPVREFPKNSLTIDIFGNSFYRSYDFGASDDVGVFWNDAVKFDKYQMLFLTAVINKALSRKYDYGHKLRASQTTNFEILLPVSAEGTPDFDFMSNLMRAMQKVVIKGVVEWADKRVEKTKGVIAISR